MPAFGDRGRQGVAACRGNFVGGVVSEEEMGLQLWQRTQSPNIVTNYTISCCMMNANFRRGVLMKFRKDDCAKTQDLQIIANHYKIGIDLTEV